MHWDQKLDSRIAGAVMGIQAFKGVEIGMGCECARLNGSQVHDPIAYDATLKQSPSLGFVRASNNAGGLEGGMTNGMPIVVKGTMKPISTLLRGLPSVDLNTKSAQDSQYERSDVSAISAASVVMENVVAFEVAKAFRDKFSGDLDDRSPSPVRRVHGDGPGASAHGSHVELIGSASVQPGRAPNTTTVRSRS